MTTAHDTTALAGHGRRIAAALLDGVFYSLVVAAAGAVGFGVGLALANGADSSDDGWETLGWLLVSTFLGLLVGIVLWLVLVVWLVRRPGARNGQTLGKQIVGIRAVCADGAGIGVGRALVREALAKGVLVGLTSSAISGLLGFLDGGAIGILVALLVSYGPAFADDRRRTLHDRLVDTRVIDAQRGPGAMPAGDEPLWPVAGQRRSGEPESGGQARATTIRSSRPSMLVGSPTPLASKPIRTASTSPAR